MKKLIVIILLTFFSCMVAEQKSQKKIDVIQIIENDRVESIDMQFELYSSGIEMNLSEIKLNLFFQKYPYKIVE